jgi:hypothetical protein
LSVQAFLRFIPSSRFHAKEVEFAIDLSSASVIARQVMEDAISFFYLSEPGLTKEEKRFRELVWRFHGATEAIDSAAFMGSAHETESIPLTEYFPFRVFSSNRAGGATEQDLLGKGRGFFPQGKSRRSSLVTQPRRP